MELLDAFSVRWSGENKWLFPRTYLIPKVLRHLQWSLAYGTLVLPWWPLLIVPVNRFRSEVIDFLVVEPKANMFIPIVPGISMFSDQAQNLSLLLLRLSFCKGHK